MVTVVGLRLVTAVAAVASMGAVLAVPSLAPVAAVSAKIAVATLAAVSVMPVVILTTGTVGSQVAQSGLVYSGQTTRWVSARFLFWRAHDIKFQYVSENCRPWKSYQLYRISCKGLEGSGCPVK